MPVYPKIPCEGCGKPIDNRPDRKTLFCKACTWMRRCPLCKSVLPANSEDHKCKSVDLKTDRRCTECNKPLSNSGYERWKNVCGQCTKKQWRDRERQERKQLRQHFGGKCAKCGYDRCETALHFHHIDETEKYEWSRKGGAALREIKAHPERFQLLCANCHIELHEQEKNYQHQKVERSEIRKSREHYLQEIAPTPIQYPLRKDNKSGYRGVSPKDGKWTAVINYNHRQKFLGYFDTPREAAIAYDTAAKAYGKSKQVLNFPEEITHAEN